MSGVMRNIHYGGEPQCVRNHIGIMTVEWSEVTCDRCKAARTKARDQKHGPLTPHPPPLTSEQRVSAIGLHHACFRCGAEMVNAGPPIGYYCPVKTCLPKSVDAVPTGGLRYNQGKPRLDLISPWAQEGLGEVLTFGMKKYSAWNWTKGLSWSETVASLERHLIAFKKGEDIDPDSKLPHLDHIACNAHFLSHFQKTKTGTDDRWRLSDVLGTKKENKS